MNIPIVTTDDCIGCGICVDECPNEVLELIDGVASLVNDDDCIGCAECEEACPMGAITMSDDE